MRQCVRRYLFTLPAETPPSAPCCRGGVIFLLPAWAALPCGRGPRQCRSGRPDPQLFKRLKAKGIEA